VQPVFTAEQMRRLDRHAIAELGLPGATLMENAGRGAADALLAALPERDLRPRGLRVAIVCGKGGNGGDGFVVARRLKRAGAIVGAFTMRDGEVPTGLLVAADRLLSDDDIAAAVDARDREPAPRARAPPGSRRPAACLHDRLRPDRSASYLVARTVCRLWPTRMAPAVLGWH